MAGSQTNNTNDLTEISMDANRSMTDGVTLANPFLDSVMVAELPQGFTAIDDPQPCGKNKKTELKEDHVAANDDVEKESVLHMI